MSSAPSAFKRMLVPFSTLSIALLGISSCNVFAPIDHPGSDPQYLSAARACFDRGDFACARENYSKLSGSYADTATAEEGFITLDEQGASMGAIMEFVGNLIEKNTGVALTVFANRLTNGAGVEKRIAIWNIYKSTQNGSISNPDLKNFVQFVSSIALTAEMLAESSRGNAQLLPADIATSSSACEADILTCGIGSANCDAPAGATLVYGSGSIPDITTTKPTNPYPSTRQLYDSVNSTLVSLQALSASGKFSNTVKAFEGMKAVIGASSSLDGGPNLKDQCFRFSLLTLGIGTI